ncbi:hypothetical protein ACLOJK_036634 [Asimina triloba]
MSPPPIYKGGAAEILVGFYVAWMVTCGLCGPWRGECRPGARRLPLWPLQPPYRRQGATPHLLLLPSSHYLLVPLQNADLRPHISPFPASLPSSQFPSHLQRRLPSSNRSPPASHRRIAHLLPSPPPSFPHHYSVCDLLPSPYLPSSPHRRSVSPSAISSHLQFRAAPISRSPFFPHPEPLLLPSPDLLSSLTPVGNLLPSPILIYSDLLLQSVAASICSDLLLLLPSPDLLSSLTPFTIS